MDIRPETAADRAAVHALNRAAFGRPMQAALTRRYRGLNCTGTVKTMVPPGTSGGGAGTGEARRTMATAS